MLVTYEIFFDHAGSRDVPVGKCPCCGKASTVHLDFQNTRVRCLLFSMSLPILPAGSARCAACGENIARRRWPAEVSAVFKRDRKGYRGRFRFRPGLFLIAIILVVAGMYIYQAATLPLGYKESDDSYLAEKLDNLRPGMRIAVSTSVNGRDFRMPILVDRVEGGLIHARPYRVRMENATYYLHEDTDLSEAAFSGTASLVFSRAKSDNDLLLKEVDGKPAPRFTPRVSVHRIYGQY